MEQECQIEVTDNIREAASEIEGEGDEFIKNAIDFLEKNIDYQEYDEETAEHEHSIRWKRTADQILKDGYIYKQKGCTDRVILFQALCEARGFQTNFVKVKEKGGRAIHSVAEVEVSENEWKTVDVGGRAGIKKGRLGKGEDFGRWEFWMRGRDAWDLGFTGYGKIPN